MPSTASQVLEAGDYLREDFDFQTLTMPVLRSLLIYHNVKPSGNNKTALVKDCVTRIKKPHTELRLNREYAARSVASCISNSQTNRCGTSQAKETSVSRRHSIAEKSKSTCSLTTSRNPFQEGDTQSADSSILPDSSEGTSSQSDADFFSLHKPVRIHFEISLFC